MTIKDIKNHQSSIPVSSDVYDITEDYLEGTYTDLDFASFILNLPTLTYCYTTDTEKMMDPDEQYAEFFVQLNSNDDASWVEEYLFPALQKLGLKVPLDIWTQECVACTDTLIETERFKQLLEALGFKQIPWYI